MELKSNGEWQPVNASKKGVASGRKHKTEQFQAQEQLYLKYKKLEESKPKSTEKQFEVRRK
jgi:hypothetical protein